MPHVELLAAQPARGAIAEDAAAELIEAAPEFAALHTNEVRFGQPHGNAGMLITPLSSAIVAAVLSAPVDALPEPATLAETHPVHGTLHARGRHARYIRELVALVRSFDKHTTPQPLLAVVHSSDRTPGVHVRARPVLPFFERPAVRAINLDAAPAPLVLYKSAGDNRPAATLERIGRYVGRTLKRYGLALAVIANQQHGHVVAAINFGAADLKPIPTFVDAPTAFAEQPRLRLLVISLRAEADALLATDKEAHAQAIVATEESYAIAYTQYATIDLLHQAYDATGDAEHRLIVLVHDLPTIPSLVLVYDTSFVGAMPERYEQQQQRLASAGAASASSGASSSEAPASAAGSSA